MDKSSTQLKSVKSTIPLITLCLTLILMAVQSVWAAEISWTGCGITKKAFMTEIAAVYEKETGIKTKLSGGGATKGIRSASAGSSEMGGTCRHWLGDINNKHPQEKAAELTQVAWDALVVITHQSNPVDNISLTDLKKIYNGEITSWKTLGGPDKRIALVTREGKNSGVGYMFRLIAFNTPDYKFKARSLKVKSTGPMEKKVEKTVTAMGIDGISSAKKRKLKFLSLDGINPTKDNIASGKYPLFRPLYLATGPGSSAEAKKLLDFVLSEEGQDVISSQGTVNLKEGSILKALWDDKKKKFGL